MIILIKKHGSFRVKSNYCKLNFETIQNLLILSSSFYDICFYWNNCEKINYIHAKLKKHNQLPICKLEFKLTFFYNFEYTCTWTKWIRFWGIVNKLICLPPKLCMANPTIDRLNFNLTNIFWIEKRWVDSSKLYAKI